MSDYQRRQSQRSAGGDFFSRLVACFLGTLFGTLVSGVLLLLIVRAYLHWSVKSTLDEMGKDTPTFTMPTMPKPPEPGRVR